MFIIRVYYVLFKLSEIKQLIDSHLRIGFLLTWSSRFYSLFSFLWKSFLGKTCVYLFSTKNFYARFCTCFDSTFVGQCLRKYPELSSKLRYYNNNYQIIASLIQSEFLLYYMCIKVSSNSFKILKVKWFYNISTGINKCLWNIIGFSCMLLRVVLTNGL